ncbi:MAG: hypothetical protein QNM02_01730, partial [Acidimicrobiia bacterium]|nr:hypothetical protein [Acidimicrobiia bacterium]
MRIEVGEPCPLPDDPVLAEWATTLSDTGDWGWILDSSWRTVFMTDEQRLGFAAGVEMVPIVIGEHLFGSEMVDVSAHWRTGPTTDATWRDKFSKLGGLVLADTPGGKDELRSLVHPSLVEIVDELAPSRRSATAASLIGTGTTGRNESVAIKVVRIRDGGGHLRGTALLFKPEAGMNVLGAMAYDRDLDHLERLNLVASARRRPAAILFTDLEGSSALSRTLSTGS